MTFPKEEPSALNRDFARFLRDMFVALVNEGFTEAQALAILGATISGSFGGKS